MNGILNDLIPHIPSHTSKHTRCRFIFISISPLRRRLFSIPHFSTNTQKNRRFIHIYQGNDITLYTYVCHSFSINRRNFEAVAGGGFVYPTVFKSIFCSSINANSGPRFLFCYFLRTPRVLFIGFFDCAAVWIDGFESNDTQDSNLLVHCILKTRFFCIWERIYSCSTITNDVSTMN